jgi:hypothetical protein
MTEYQATLLNTAIAITIMFSAFFFLKNYGKKSFEKTKNIYPQARKEPRIKR